VHTYRTFYIYIYTITIIYIHVYMIVMVLELITNAHSPVAGSTKSARRRICQHSLSSAVIIFIKKAHLEELLKTYICIFSVLNVTIGLWIREEEALVTTYDFNLMRKYTCLIRGSFRRLELPEHFRCIHHEFTHLRSSGYYTVTCTPRSRRYLVTCKP
jgi:hypothetical protein